MRQAKRLGLPGLMAMVAALGIMLLGGGGNGLKVSAQGVNPLAPSGTFAGTSSKSCQQSFQGTNQNPTGVPVVTDCKLSITLPTAPTGSAWTSVEFLDILLDPNACFLPGGSDFMFTPSNSTQPVCQNGVTRVDSDFQRVPSPLVFSQACPAVIGETITGGSAGGAAALTCALPPIAVTGPTTLCEEIDLQAVLQTGTGSFTTAATKFQVCPPNPPQPPTAVNPLAGLQVTKTCAPDFNGATASSTKVTDCTLVFTTTSSGAASVFNNGTHLEFDTITGANAAFSPAAVGGGGSTTTGCENGVGGGGILSANNTVYTCIVGPIIVSGATTLCETVQVVDPLTGISSAKL